MIREIRHYQHIPYRIEHQPRVTTYLMDTSLLLDEEYMYKRSLELETRPPRPSLSNIHTLR